MKVLSMSLILKVIILQIQYQRGGKVWNLPGNTVSNNAASRKCNNWTYAYYRFSFKKSILKPIFLSNNSGGQD